MSLIPVCPLLSTSDRILRHRWPAGRDVLGPTLTVLPTDEVVRLSLARFDRLYARPATDRIRRDGMITFEVERQADLPVLHRAMQTSRSFRPRRRALRI